ncbi:MAG TPA: hypothetical protein VGM90_00400 [Kofleriaceae bacterium]|jgi:hypothetical protein
MKMIRIVVLIGAAISLVVSLLWSLLTRMPGAARGRARKLLADAEWLGEDSKDGALVKLTGIVRARSAEERLMAPLSNVRCVALRLRAQARRGIDPRAKYAEKIEYKAFELEDTDGRVEIDPTEVLFDLAPLKEGKPDGTVRAKVLADLGHASAHAAKSNVEETIVEVGATVTLAGTLATVAGKHRLTGPVACASQRIVDLSREP